jgi:hypothetical protein
VYCLPDLSICNNNKFAHSHFSYIFPRSNIVLFDNVIGILIALLNKMKMESKYVQIIIIITSVNLVILF